MPTLPSDQGWRAIQFKVSSPSAGSCFQRLERALGFVAPAHVLDHHRVAVVHEGLVIRGDIGALPVGRAHQNRRHSTCSQGRKTLADRRTPSRIGTGTFSCLTGGLCAQARPAQSRQRTSRCSCGAGWHPARRLVTAGGVWPIENRPQLTKLPHIRCGTRTTNPNTGSRFALPDGAPQHARRPEGQ